jgi:hypothetical protein
MGAYVLFFGEFGFLEKEKPIINAILWIPVLMNLRGHKMYGTKLAINYSKINSRSGSVCGQNQR